MKTCGARTVETKPSQKNHSWNGVGGLGQAGTRQIMMEGMRADFRAVDALSQRLIERARHAERIMCRTAHGTDFEGEFSPKLK